MFNRTEELEERLRTLSNYFYNHVEVKIPCERAPGGYATSAVDHQKVAAQMAAMREDIDLIMDFLKVEKITIPEATKMVKRQ